MTMFANATKVAQPAKAAKGKAKQTTLISGLRELAMIDGLMKALTGVKASFESNVKSRAADLFFDQVSGSHKRPESFRGTDRDASASIEMRKRSTMSALTEAEVKMLRDAGMEPAKEVAVTECFVINPAYSHDTALLSKVEAALTGVVPADFIQKQDEKFKYTVTDDILETICKGDKDGVVNRDLLKLATVLACKPRLDNTDVAEILDFVKTLITAPTPAADAARDLGKGMAA